MIEAGLADSAAGRTRPVADVRAAFGLPPRDSMHSTISLRPATLGDRRAVYEWLACSDLTAAMMGPPEFTENAIPTWEQFCADYEEYFFDGSQPQRGRSLIIEHNSEAVGHVSYSVTDPQSSLVELDIWMRDASCCGRGFGSEALRMLSDELFRMFGAAELIMRPSARNLRAIRAYERAGFVRLTRDAAVIARDGGNEYRDTVVLRRVRPT